MPTCASCGEPHDVRLFEGWSGRRLIREWYCPVCAWEPRQQGLEPAPEWIERAVLRKLPLKDLRLVLSDRRRGERRHPAH